MTYKFYSIEHNFTLARSEKCSAIPTMAFQNLLRKWNTAILYNKCPVMEKVNISLKIYNFQDYYDQAYLKEIIKTEYSNKNKELYWGGNKYDSLDKLFEDLSEQKLFAELIVKGENV